jgi:hypothetical protein
MNKLVRQVFVLMLLAGGSARALWIGNPASSLMAGGSGFAIDYDGARRDLEPRHGGPRLAFDHHQVALEWTQATSPIAQFSLRLLPGLGRMNLEGNGFNPTLWGGGVGLRLAPPDKIGPVALGLSGAWEGSLGSTKRVGGSGRDSAAWMEGVGAAGVAYDLPVPVPVSVYGGVSVAKTWAHVEVANVKSRWESTDLWGGFFGVEFRPVEAWSFSAEGHGGNERALALAVSYRYQK